MNALDPPPSTAISSPERGIMKRSMLAPVILMAIALIRFVPASSQEPSPPPQLYLMGDFLVDASRVAENESAFGRKAPRSSLVCP